MCFDFCLFLILLISCSDVAASNMADETNAGVTAFVAEITSMCGLRWDGIAAVNSLDYFLCLQMLFHDTPPLSAVSYMFTAFISGMHTAL